jgi:hypothetical protein
MAHWFNDPAVYRELGEALTTAGSLSSSEDDSDNLLAYFQNPTEFESEYEAWNETGRPTSDADDGWSEFVDLLDSMNEEEEEEEDEDE